MHDTKSVPALVASYPPEPTRPDTGIGWAQGLLSDGWPWNASILEDEEGDRTLVIRYPALAHEGDNEHVVVEHLLAEQLLVPLLLHRARGGQPEASYGHCATPATRMLNRVLRSTAP